MDTKLETMNDAVAGSYITKEWMEKVVASMDGTPDDDFSRGFLTAMAFMTCSAENKMHGTSAAYFLDNARKHLERERQEEILRCIVEALSGAAMGGDE